MKKLKVGIYAAGAYLVLIIVFSVTTARRGAGQDDPKPTQVIVANKVEQSVPVIVQNTLQVAGKVQAEIPHPIEISPAGNEVCATDCNALSAVQREGFSGFSGNAANPLSYTVPAGRRLVIETVSGRAALGSEESGWFEVVSIVDGNEASYHFQAAEFGNNWVATQPLRIYADGGTVVRLVCHRRGPRTITTGVWMSFAGYLVDDH